MSQLLERAEVVIRQAESFLSPDNLEELKKELKDEEVEIDNFVNFRVALFEVLGDAGDSNLTEAEYLLLGLAEAVHEIEEIEMSIESEKILIDPEEFSEIDDHFSAYQAFAEEKIKRLENEKPFWEESVIKLTALAEQKLLGEDEVIFDSTLVLALHERFEDHLESIYDMAFKPAA